VSAPRQGGARFAYASVAERYEHRPRYPEQVMLALRSLLPGERARVLDAGTGTGRIARALAPHAERVDAVDPSAEMLRVARTLAGGTHPSIRWLRAPIESAPLEPPYQLAVCAESFHWFDADRALERFADVLAPPRRLALVEGDHPVGEPWYEPHVALIQEMLERMTGKRPVWGDASLERPLLLHDRYAAEGFMVTEPVLVEQSVASFIACQHSRQTFCLEAMGDSLARQHDERLREILAPHADRDGMLRYEHRTRVEWGRVVVPGAG
jgi:SAM-dependent methyltransferase